MNPLIPLVLLPLALVIPATKFISRDLVIPSLVFIAIYSLQPHKEARFIIYVVPPLTAAASLSASYIWTRKTKSVLYAFGSLILVASVLGSFIASSGMLFISSLNYPGGDALSQLHTLILRDLSRTHSSRQPSNISIHMDVLSCMTGVTRFQQYPTLPLRLPRSTPKNLTIHYDKTENSTLLAVPEFWKQFDYALMEEPGLAIGKWEVLDTVFAYAGMEILRPGDGSSFGERLEEVYRANNLTVGDGEEEGEAPGSEDVKKGVEAGVGRGNKEEKKGFMDLKTKLMFEEMGKFGTYNLIRDAGRLVTGGWWVGPRMEGRIRILRRVKDWDED
jgi:alpha-1,6-mannosyltransferase